MMRKLQESDKFFIEKMRMSMRQQQSSFLDQSYSSDSNMYDEFHNLFIKYHFVKNACIVNTKLTRNQQKGQEFTVYTVQVETDQLVFQVDRRFKQFHSLFKTIKKEMSGQLQFPSKNYNPFVSSVSPSIVKQRIHKLDIFLKQIVEESNTKKNPKLSTKLFNFIDLKETYQNKFKGSCLTRKSTSQKSSQQKFYHSFRGHSSQKSFHSYSQNSIELYIILINEHNPGKHLQKLEEIIRNKKYKMSNQEIKAIFLGFQNYYGLLKFGLINSFQSNRIVALQILVDLLLPERNIIFQRYAKFLEKAPLQLWVLQDINYLDNSVFKVLYFRLLSIYCERAARDQSKGEKYILKNLFMFHNNLKNDYFQWKQINQIQFRSIKRRNSRSMPQYLNHWSQTNSQTSQKPIQKLQPIKSKTQSIEIFFNQQKNTLILITKTTKTKKQIKETSLKWNRFVQKYELQQFTQHFLYYLKNEDKNWNIKIKVEEDQYNQIRNIQKNTILTRSVFNMLETTFKTSFYRIKKQQSLYDYYPDYLQEILVVQDEDQEQKLIIGIKVSKDVDIFKGCLREYADMLAEDCLNSYT